jgi:anti-sigma regulatory factor (Ser/Thr protein kinase)
MTDPWPLRSSLELGALSSAVSCACLHVRHVLWEWGLKSLTERAELLVSELVTSAVNAAAQPGQTVSVNLAGTGTGTGTRVVIEVRDAGSPAKVVRRELATDASAPDADTAPPAPASLPRRVPRTRPKPRAEIATDLDILRRLRDHLRSPDR